MPVVNTLVGLTQEGVVQNVGKTFGEMSGKISMGNQTYYDGQGQVIETISSESVPVDAKFSDYTFGIASDS